MEQYKRAKVIMLPTNVLSNISLSNKTNNLVYNNNKHDTLSMFTNQHLYIISDDEIKEGDWYINLKYNKIIQKKDALPLKDNCKKIIATTDTSLLNTIYTPHISGEISKRMRDLFNLPQPSQQFIEKYIESYNKGKVITDVLVEYEQTKLYIEPQNYQQYISQPKELQFPITTNVDDIYGLKINSKDNTITIKKLKDSWNREEMIAEIRKYAKDSLNINRYEDIFFTNKWIEENL